MHVSEQGVDTNDGCTPQTATKTLGAALARVATRNIPGLEVHLCRGTYPEGSIRIQTPVVVRGGYNCVDWKRVDGFGARDFVDPNLVKVTSNDPLRRTTLELATTAITASTILEGFMIEGPQGGETGSSTVSVFEGAAPVFRSMQILGGKSSNPSGPGTEGLRVHSGAVEVDRSIITGGNGTGAAGSVGLHAIASSVNVHDSTLDGGTGAAERNGVRAALIETGANMKQVFRQNLIKWGRTIVNTANAALGIYVDGGEVEIEENRILGGDVECNTAPCSVYAIAFANVSSAKVIKNTISGGTLANPGGLPNTVALVGISSRTTPGFIAQGNIIHPGTTGAAGVVAIGIDVSSAFGPQIVGNTILAVAGSAESRGSAVRLSTGAGTGSINAVVEGNIFAGVDRNEDVGLEMASCHGASMSSMKSNLFVTHRRVFVDYSDPSCQPKIGRAHV